MPRVRYVSDPQDTLEIVAETAGKVVLKVQTYERKNGGTKQFEFQLNSRQIDALLTFGASPR